MRLFPRRASSKLTVKLFLGVRIPLGIPSAAHSDDWLRDPLLRLLPDLNADSQSHRLLTVV